MLTQNNDECSIIIMLFFSPSLEGRGGEGSQSFGPHLVIISFSFSLSFFFFFFGVGVGVSCKKAATLANSLPDNWYIVYYYQILLHLLLGGLISRPSYFVCLFV